MMNAIIKLLIFLVFILPLGHICLCASDLPLPASCIYKKFADCIKENNPNQFSHFNHYCINMLKSFAPNTRIRNFPELTDIRTLDLAIDITLENILNSQITASPLYKRKKILLFHNTLKVKETNEPPFRKYVDGEYFLYPPINVTFELIIMADLLHDKCVLTNMCELSALLGKANMEKLISFLRAL